MLTRDVTRNAQSARDLVAVARAHDVADTVAMRGTGRSGDELDDPRAEIPSAVELQIITNVLRALPEVSDLGVRAGSRCHPSAFGMTGLLMTCSATLRDACAAAIRFQDLTYPLTVTTVERAGTETILTANVGAFAAETRAYLVDHKLATDHVLVQALTGSAMRIRRLELSCAEPPHAAWYEETLGVRPRYEAAADRIVIDDAALDVPMPQSNPVVVDQLVADCVAELERRRATIGMAGPVRERLTAATDRVPSLREIAVDLHVAERTLRRRLEAEGTSFRALDAAARADRARRMLETTDLPIEVIADRLGYSLASAFTHAFRRWTGQTPSGYRDTVVTRQIGRRRGR